ncbi:MAG: 3-beta hydroxysteroid dehydrogenase/isomerase family [Promethearchaeota archaeon CR_4]|nr:MAG: 3-beta hydroxysteroid dehydrogenase/isomerase family [Candidatus Lokiarchaeota archaeon CR_4]
MKILVTGAFGNIGSHVVTELLQRGYDVACFDLKTKANVKTAKQWADKIQCFWGDIDDPAALVPAIQGRELVIHLAAIIPPRAAREPDYTSKVNVGGTRNVVEAISQLNPCPNLIFTSSMGVYGDTLDLPPPRTVQDPLRPFEIYGQTKKECEDIIHKSSLKWIIFRLGNAPSSKAMDSDPMMFQIRVDTRMEFVHPADVARAIANAITCDEAWEKTFNLGGGKRCQLLYKDFIGGILETVGIGKMPDAAFGSNHFYTDWLDTEESERLLKYQQLEFKDYLQELSKAMGSKKIFIRMLRPLIRKKILKASPNWESIKAQK